MTPEKFIKEYYDFDEDNFEPQVPFIHLSLSDLADLLNSWSLTDTDILFVTFVEWVRENYRADNSGGWYHKDDGHKQFIDVTDYTTQELFNIFRHEVTNEVSISFWENEYEKLRREFAELQGDNLILIGKIKQLESDIENLTIN